MYAAFVRPKPAPDVSFSTIEGEALSTAGLRGKVVLVNFWATSCVTCVREMPRLVATYRKHRARGFETVAVAMRYDPPNYVLAYAKRAALPFKVALDPQGEAARRFGDVEFTPTTFVIDRGRAGSSSGTSASRTSASSTRCWNKSSPKAG